MEDSDFQNARYAGLMGLWIHQNSMQLQWPAVIVAAALVVVSLVIQQLGDSICDVAQWGSNPKLILNAGIPLLLTGIGAIPIIYTMRRARRILTQVEQLLAAIERDHGVGSTHTFEKLNHPPGFSGALLLRLFMTVCLAIPMTAIGFAIVLGPIFGIVIALTALVAWGLVERNR